MSTPPAFSSYNAYYDPFGLSYSGVTAGDALPFWYSTQYFDSESCLYSFIHRPYLPELGRFLSCDPMEESGGLNLYAYCENDPVNNVDYLGLWPWSRYTKSQQKNQTTSVTIKKECTIVLLYGHGSAKDPHEFIFKSDKKTAAGFVGCFSETTNKHIPEGKQIHNLESVDFVLHLGIAENYFPEESFHNFYNRGKENAIKTAKSFCLETDDCCTKVYVYGVKTYPIDKLYDGKALNRFPGEWKEVIDCKKERRNHQKGEPK